MNTNEDNAKRNGHLEEVDEETDFGGVENEEGGEDADYDSISEDEADDDEEEEEEETALGEAFRGDGQATELTQEYWNIHKLVKYLRAGTSTVTLIALIGLKECGLKQQPAQLALKSAGGIEILLNILRTSAMSCIIGSLQVLEMACTHPGTRIAVYQLGGVQALQQLLKHHDMEVRGMAASVLAQVCAFSSAKAVFIKGNGLPILVSMLRFKRNADALWVVEAAARALWACSNSKNGRRDLLKGRLLDTIGHLLPSSKESVLIPVVGILHRCLVQRAFRSRMETDGHMTHLIRLLLSPNPRLQCLAAKALAMAAISEATRNRLVSEGGLSTVVKLMVQESRGFIATFGFPPGHPARKVSVHAVPEVMNEDDSPTETPTELEGGKQPGISILSKPVDTKILKKANILLSSGKPKQTDTTEYVSEFPIDEGDLLEAVTGILWEVSKSSHHVKQIHSLRAVPVLTALLHHPEEKVIRNAVGILGEVALIPNCCTLIVSEDGIPRLLELLQRNSDKLLLNVIRALDSCARNSEALDQLLGQEGLRLLWSHLKSPNEKIQASAANAICTCLRQEKEGLAEVVRSLVGGIELLVALLESPCEAVLSSVCAAIARIAADPQNLAIMTDYGAVTCLSKLAVRENDTLRPYLAEAIAACCVSRETGLLFGQAGAVAPLVQYLETNDSKIRRPTCRALHRLSLEPENCVTLHQSGAVKLLIEMLGSEDEVVQEAAADCLRNIRILALQRCKERDTDGDVFKLKPKKRAPKINSHVNENKQEDKHSYYSRFARQN